jgi:hypothetical protein
MAAVCRGRPLVHGAGGRTERGSTTDHPTMTADGIAELRRLAVPDRRDQVTRPVPPEGERSAATVVEVALRAVRYGGLGTSRRQETSHAMIGQSGWVAEYLLGATDGDFRVIHHDDLAALHPDDVDCEAIEGWGDYRMRCGIEVAVSFDDPGIQLIRGRRRSGGDRFGRCDRGSG